MCIMKVTKETITSKLSDFVIPQGTCGKNAFRIAEILFGQQIKPFGEERYNSVGAALDRISAAIANEQIAIIWFDTGRVKPGNETYRALHCYFVFETNPLEAFTVWDTPGAKFCDELAVREKIDEAVNLFRNDGGVALQVVPASNCCPGDTKDGTKIPKT